MTDYISRDDVKKALAEKCRECEDACEEFDGIMPDCTQCLMYGAGKSIMFIPAADARPVVRGKWTLFGRRGIYGVMYECSACHAKYDGRTNFCPNCGADMRPEPPKEE